jgi:hypothetical protein
MRPRRSRASRPVELDEYERRHFALLIETLSRQGRSEREIVAAVEQALTPKRPVR